MTQHLVVVRHLNFILQLYVRITFFDNELNSAFTVVYILRLFWYSINLSYTILLQPNRWRLANKFILLETVIWRPNAWKTELFWLRSQMCSLFYLTVNYRLKVLEQVLTCLNQINKELISDHCHLIDQKLWPRMSVILVSDLTLNQACHDHRLLQHQTDANQSGFICLRIAMSLTNFTN